MTNPWSIITGLARPIVKNFPKATALQAACPSLIYGVELEIENVPHWADLVVPGLVAERDGSLRNAGMEFITSPMTYSNLAYCLENFFNKAKLTDQNYSERCSIHVHTNCLDLTFDQIKTVLFLYQMSEKLLYSWVDPGRYDNIFCVPWSQTNLTYQSLSTKIDSMTWRSWRKYTGLNLLPLYTQGTIEWRHMSGHHDLKKILKWCQLIGAIYTYAIKNSLSDVQKKLMELNTNSQYQNMLEQVFGEHVDVLLSIPTYAQDLEDGILNLKYAVQEPKSITVKETHAMVFDDFIRRDEAVQREIEAINRRVAERNRVRPILQAAVIAPAVPRPQREAPRTPILDEMNHANQAEEDVE